MSRAAKVKYLNVGAVQNLRLDGHPVSTGIFKQPVAGPLQVRELGIEGDAQADLRVHGGPLKAVYFYPSEHYQAWETMLGQGPLPPGSFGENITSEGLLETELFVGDILRMGTAQLQIIQPRSPCYKLQLRFHRPDIVALFVHQGKPGWYASVVKEGEVRADDAIEVLSRAPEGISIADIWRYSLETEAPEEMRLRIGQLTLLPDFWRDRIAQTH